MADKVFVGKKTLFGGIMSVELKKRITNHMLGLECSTICSTHVDVDLDRQKKIRSF